MKKAKVIISTDWHITENTVDQVINLIQEKINLALKLKIKNAFVLGDVFTSRKAQSLICLEGFSTILRMFSDAGINTYFIPGNHDKTNYNSVSSFLIPFKGHSNFNLVETVQDLQVEGLDITMIPFFSDDLYISLLNERVDKKNKILLTHIAFTGSVNNDGSKVENKLKPSLFNEYKMVLSGHYHDYQFISPNIHHLPSLYQGNFGEDPKKGFTVIYDDLTFEIVKSSYKPYVTVRIDLNDIAIEEVEEIAEGYKSNEEYVRFELEGSKEKIDQVDFQSLKSKGIKVSKKQEEVLIEDVVSTESFDSNDMQKEFQDFCEKRNLDFEEGMLIFKTALK